MCYTRNAEDLTHKEKPLILLAFDSYEGVRLWWQGGSSGVVGFEKIRCSCSIPTPASNSASTTSLPTRYTSITHTKLSLHPLLGQKLEIEGKRELSSSPVEIQPSFSTPRPSPSCTASIQQFGRWRMFGNFPISDWNIARHQITRVKFVNH